MSQTKEQALRAYFSAQTEALSAREQVLSADDRKDEAIFAKVQANVYNIFATVLTVAVKTCPDEEAAGRFFRQKLEQLPANLRTSLERAKQ